MDFLDDKKKALFEVCQKYKVKNLYAFGSVVTPRFNDESDVDFLVNFHDDQIADPFINFFEMIESLEHLFGRKVDLVDESAITNPYFRQEVLSRRQLVYGQPS